MTPNRPQILNRYYDPTIGRYLRIDPFGQGLNLYSYCFNNPHSWIDPLGLCAYNKVSGWVHGGLAALGLIPVLGIFPDLIDAGLYLLEGNLLDAGVAGAAAIPVIGLFTRGGEYLYKVGKWLVKSEKVSDLLKSGWKVVNNNIGALGGGSKSARNAPIKYTKPGEKFVRVGHKPENLKFTFETPGGTQKGTHAFPEETFNKIGRNPAKLKDLGDLPGSAPQYYRTLEPPPGTPIQRGTVPGGEFGGRGGALEVLFPEGF